MDSAGEFYEFEKDSELIQLVYHHPKYHPLPTSSAETTSHDRILQPLFLCHLERCMNDSWENKSDSTFQINCAPEYHTSTWNHPVLPLFWCNNKGYDADGECHVCFGSNVGTDYYFCESESKNFHKECVVSPLKIKHPYHPQHFLQLFVNFFKSRNKECLCCGGEVPNMGYHCTICQVLMHPVCAMKSIHFVINQPKRHDHPLTFFPRQTSLICNVCGLVRKNFPTFVCLRCNFVAHRDCMHSPHVIKTSRHAHRISYTSSLRSGKWYCGICRQSIDGDYGAYTCEKCVDYAVHLRCALRKDIWDGEELKDEIEEDDLTKDDGPFNIESEGLITHFLHDHHLQLEVSILYDEKKICQACILPIYEGKFYSCVKCDFTLHESCAEFRRKIQHALHPHPLTLKAGSTSKSENFTCSACERLCGGFVYACHKGKCNFDIDVRCTTISEPFNYEGHEHPLFLALDPDEKSMCKVCKSECENKLNCIQCDFIVCTKCATLPYRIRYKHDTHFLKVIFGKDVCEKDWCDACERNLGDTNTKVVYWCDICCTTVHIACLIGQDQYKKPGAAFKLRGKHHQILVKNDLSWLFCDYCKNLCLSIIFKKDKDIACSVKCWFLIV